MYRSLWTALVAGLALVSGLGGPANAFPNRSGAADARTYARWLLDEHTRCWVWDAGIATGDKVAWSGACPSGRVDGTGTLTFFKDDRFVEMVTGTFGGGRLADGRVSIVWSDGSHYDGEEKNGAFDGHGVLIEADGTREAGEWKDDTFAHERPAVQGDHPADSPAVNHVADPVPPRDGAHTVAAVASQQDQTGPATEEAADEVHVNAAWPILSSSRAKLIAVDGSTLTFTIEEGGSLQRAVSRPDGSESRNTLELLGDHIGTVADDDEVVVATFRISQDQVVIDYDNGRTEVLAPDSAGTVLQIWTAQGEKPIMTRWYSEGHVFTRDEREDALKQYAKRLEVDAPQYAATVSGPHGAEREVVADLQAVQKAHPLSRKHAKHQKPDAASVDPTPSLRPAPVDGQPPKATVPAVTNEHADSEPSATTRPSSTSVPPVTTVAVRESEVQMIDAPAPDPATINASQCLNVESNGEHWGFRNACATDVQFAYCVVDGSDVITQCGSAVAPGSVAAHGFSALIADLSLKDVNARHSFRWIGCAGGAGEVVPRLESSDPPLGRCLHERDLQGDQRSARN